MMSSLPVRPPSLARDPAYLVTQAAKAVQRLAADGLTAQGLRTPQVAVLIALDDLGPRSQRQLADHLDLDPSHLVSVIDGLADAGLVRREPDPEDRRCHRIVLTAAAAQILPGLRRDAEGWAEALTAPLSDAEVARLTELLARVVDHLDRDRMADAATGGDG